MTASEQSQDRADGEPTTASAALEEAVLRVGDRWSLLVVNALLDGPRRFNELLGAVPGLAPNILSARLRRLESARVLVAEPYSRRPPRFSYRLSARGLELGDVLGLLARWGSSAEPAGGEAHHDVCGSVVEPRWYCPTCARVVEDDSDGDDPEPVRFL